MHFGLSASAGQAFTEECCSKPRSAIRLGTQASVPVSIDKQSGALLQSLGKHHLRNPGPLFALLRKPAANETDCINLNLAAAQAGGLEVGHLFNDKVVASISRPWEALTGGTTADALDLSYQVSLVT